MADLSNHQILDLAYKVGWRKAGDLERVLAIVLAESSGNPTVTSYTGCCHGLMQINVNSTTKTPQELKDPETNMREGFRLWQSRGWQPWNSSRAGQILRGPEARASTSTWNVGKAASGAKEKAGEAAGKLPGVSEARDALQIAGRVRDWVTTPANLGRLATGIVGAIIVVIGLAVLARPVIEPVAKAAGKAADIAL
jgi:hypothetical protein